MQFDWPPELRLRIAAAQAFAEATLQPRGTGDGLDRAAWLAAAQFGVFRSVLSPDFRGQRGGGALESAAVFEAIGRGGADRGLLFAMGAHLFGCLAPLLAYASAGQAAAWEQRLRDGSTVSALAVTEAAGGSSLEHLECEARPTAGGYFLSGTKTMVANAPAADLFVVLARHAEQPGAMGLTAFLAPATARGISVSPLPAPGLRGAPIGAVTFKQCFLPDDAVLGRTGAGLRVFARAMQWERSCLLAGFLGAAERELAAGAVFLGARRDGNGPLLRHQALSHRLARGKLSLESARLLLYRAAWLIDQGHDDHAAAAMAKLAASEAVVAAAEDTVRVMAGAGWREETGNPAAALLDTLGGLFASGTSEMQLEVLARHLCGDGGPR